MLTRVALTFALSPEADGGASRFLRRFVRRRDLGGLEGVLARAGALEARLAVTKKDVRRAQKLRYRVFFEEGGAVPDSSARIIRRDVCRFDGVCDHLLVVDKTAAHCDGSPKVVGVYRLLRQDVADRNFGFYSACEFDVEALVAGRADTRFLEVGRACIAASYRGKHVLELLWRGLWAYAAHHKMDAMIGCASLPGANPKTHMPAIRALTQGGDPRWRVAPRARFTDELSQGGPVADARSLVRTLPPLVKGYWRLGATFSPIPVADPAFGATDIFVVMPIRDIEERYLNYFGVGAGAAALAV